jgi:hypothetical protein
MTRHRCFISYHHTDRKEVDNFIDLFDPNREVFITRYLGQKMSDEVINSTNTKYVMRKIRELYLRDSTVTIVLMGKYTWACRYVDWEIQSSLHSENTIKPNGLLGIKLSSFIDFPKRLNNNLVTEEEEIDCYARWIELPCCKETLAKTIDATFKRRLTHLNLINNSKERFLYNKTCV